MADKPMLLSKRQKQALLTMVSDRPKFSEMSEGQQRYVRAKAKKILDEKAARDASLKQAGELNYRQDHNSFRGECEPGGREIPADFRSRSCNRVV